MSTWAGGFIGFIAGIAIVVVVLMATGCTIVFGGGGSIRTENKVNTTREVVEETATIEDVMDSAIKSADGEETKKDSGIGNKVVNPRKATR